MGERKIWTWRNRERGEAAWLQVERQFQATRDRQMKITLPKVTCLSEEDESTELRSLA